MTAGEWFAFVALSAVILLSGLFALRAKHLVHATMLLAAMLVGVAGIFILLKAELLAGVQVLVYVGAILTLFLFTVMFTREANT